VRVVLLAVVVAGQILKSWRLGFNRNEAKSRVTIAAQSRLE
jgi:hypothetical protein